MENPKLCFSNFPRHFFSASLPPHHIPRGHSNCQPTVPSWTYCSVMQAKARRISEARATAFPERNWDQPALRILSNSHARRSLRRLPHSPASPKSGASRTLLRASSSRLPPPSRTHGPLELVTERWKSSSRQCHGLPATHHSQIICNSKTAEAESCRLPEPESQFWHLLFPTSHSSHFTLLCRGHLQSSGLSHRLGIAKACFLMKPLSHQERNWIYQRGNTCCPCLMLFSHLFWSRICARTRWFGKCVQ